MGSEPTSAGIDLAIAEPSMTGLGLGPVMIRQFLDQFVFTNSSIRAVVADREESNLRSLHAFRKAGFNVVNTARLAGEGYRRQVMRLVRA